MNDPEPIVELTISSEEIPTHAPALKNSSSLVFSIVASCSGPAIFTVINPAAQISPTLVIISLFAMCALYCWSCTTIMRYIPHRHDVMLDRIVAEDYPKYKLPILIICQASSWLLMFVVIIVMVSYIYQVIMDQIFDRFKSTAGAKWPVIFPALIGFGLSFIKDSSIFVKLTSIGFISEIISLCDIIYVAARYSTPEDVKCYYRSWKDVGNYGAFKVSRTSGVKAVFTFAGVMATSLYLQSIVQSVFVVAKKPSHNRINLVYAYSVLFLLYLVIVLAGAVPTACNPASSPGDYLTGIHANRDAFGIITQIVYGLLQVASIPLFLHISRSSIGDYLPPFKHWVMETIMATYAAIIIAVSAALAASGTSLQILFSIAGVVSGIVWAAILPAAYHTIKILGTPWAWLRIILAWIYALIIILVLILQFCL